VKEGRKMSSARGRPRNDDILTPREWQVVDLLEQGLTNEQIGDRLQISFGGAKFHVAEIISKLGAEDRHEAVRLARGLKRKHAGLLGWMLTRLRFASSRPVLVGGAAVALLASILLLGTVVTTWFPWRSSGPNQPDVGQALADFESGNSQHQFLAQAQFDPTGCVTGEEARNPRSPEGLVMSLTKTFKTLTRPNAFFASLCHAHARPTYGYTISMRPARLPLLR
jgi:DNA-binding CsgD family transcriptional regulator